VKIPRDINGAQLVKALRGLGYAVVRQDGSHIRLTSTQNGQHHVTEPLTHASRHTLKHLESHCRAPQINA